MAYTENETLERIREELTSIETVYKSSCVNWSGFTSDTKRRYTEIIAADIRHNFQLFDAIQRITRERSYYSPSHARMRIDLEKSNRMEEIFAKRINRLEFKQMGRILDFQIPIKNSSRDLGIGKFDLISFSAKKKRMFLLELKHGTNTETLLRAMLESFTYYKTVNENKLINDFREIEQISKETKTKPAVLVTPGCTAYSELEQMEKGERPELKKLAKALSISFFTLGFQENMIAY